MKYAPAFFGELIGTFILVFLGCSTVAVTVLFSAHTSLFHVAMLWGMAVTLAIYATRHLSCAHLNPAVTLAMVISRRMSIDKLPVYLLAQLCGAFLAAVAVYMLFSQPIAEFELINGITRGTPQSVATAMIFGQFYPNPTLEIPLIISTGGAFAAEAVGTFIFIFMILALTEGCNVGRPDDNLAPLFVGVTLAVIISIIAPLTQAGLNPARDLSPRVFAYLAGWDGVAFPEHWHGFFTVYVLGPLAGGTIASLLFSWLIHPLMRGKDTELNSCCPVTDD